VRGKTVNLIDGGIATGPTVRAAVCAFERPTSPRGSSSPWTAAGSAYRELRPEVDELVALMRPEPFHGVGAPYEDFSHIERRGGH